MAVAAAKRMPTHLERELEIGRSIPDTCPLMGRFVPHLNQYAGPLPSTPTILGGLGPAFLLQTHTSSCIGKP